MSRRQTAFDILGTNSRAFALPSPIVVTGKRRRSPPRDSTHTCMKKAIAKMKMDETSEFACHSVFQASAPLGLKPNKRGRNWNEEDTTVFIGVWSDNYSSLMHGGSRNAPIYNSMAEELNTLLPDKCLSGADIKSKIGNLVTEYRRKRKQQGKTGGSPSTWKYYDMVDKLLGKSDSFLHPPHSCLTGERPYNDDSLLSDSMTIEQDQLLADIENVVVPDLNLTQLAQQVNDANPLASINDEPIIHADLNLSTTSSPSNAAGVAKLGTSVEFTPTPKKIVGSKKKKKASDVK